MASFDYIIVGGGAAGCVLAHRLSSNPQCSVLLLEAGGSGKHPFVQMPKGLAKIMTDAKRIYAYLTKAEPGNGQQPEVWARGKLLGGSSAINGMMYVRGQPDDYRAIANQTSDDWDWPAIAKAFEQVENHELGAGPSRGGAGPQKITLAPKNSQLIKAMVAAGERLGWQVRDDFNQPDNEDCIAMASWTIANGVRQSAYTSFVEPIESRSNLTIVTQAIVDRVIFNGTQAQGVLARVNGVEQEFICSKEVILAGGAMASPGILQRSGIGDQSLLKSLGISVLVHNPEVGQNLSEHRLIMAQWKLNSRESENNQYGGWRLLKNALRYFLNKSGPMAAGAFNVAARMKSSSQADRPDIQFIIAPYSFDFPSGREKLEPFPGMNIGCHPLRPTSRGHVNIVSRDPNQLPEVVPNYRSTKDDIDLMVRTIEIAREYAAQSPLKELIVEETYPGPEATSKEAIIAAYDKYASCGYHAVGTCRMGKDQHSVVDEALRVRGVQGLRVMDTSVMPQIPSGNTYGPTMVMAWRAADLIQRDG